MKGYMLKIILGGVDYYSPLETEDFEEAVQWAATRLQALPIDPDHKQVWIVNQANNVVGAFIMKKTYFLD